MGSDDDWVKYLDTVLNEDWRKKTWEACLRQTRSLLVANRLYRKEWNYMVKKFDALPKPRYDRINGPKND